MAVARHSITAIILRHSFADFFPLCALARQQVQVVLFACQIPADTVQPAQEEKVRVSKKKK